MIGIIGAMGVEVEGLKALMEGKVSPNSPPSRRCGSGIFIPLRFCTSSSCIIILSKQKNEQIISLFTLWRSL